MTFLSFQVGFVFTDCYINAAVFVKMKCFIPDSFLRCSESVLVGESSDATQELLCRFGGQSLEGSNYPWESVV